MTLKEHYKYHSRKSIKPYSRILLLLILVIVCSGTISKYTSGAISNNGIIDVAKWSIIINDEEITNTSSQLEMDIDLFNADDDTTDIALGDECYFDITIKPITTEVAIEYSIDVDLDNSNLPNGTIIEKYEKYVNTEENEILDKEENINSDNVSLTEQVHLPQNETSLDNTSIRRYRVFCKLPSTTDSIEVAEFYIDPQITVNQLIEG